MYVFVDDVRNAPLGHDWIVCRSVNQFLALLTNVNVDEMEFVSLDHDLGDYYSDGGDAWKIVDYFAENDTWPEIVRVHSANPVGIERMLSTIDRYGPYAHKPDFYTRSK